MWVHLLVLRWLYFAVLATETNADVCSNPACTEMANTLQYTMDPSVSPCEDFWLYACGGYTNKTVIPDYLGGQTIEFEISSRIWDIVKKELECKSLNGNPPLFRKAKEFYQSCMDTDTIEKRGLADMKKRLRKYGMWPVLEEKWEEKRFDWIDVTKKITDDGQINTMLVYINVGLSELNASQAVIKLGSADTGIGVFYLLEGLNNPVVQRYYGALVDIAVEFGAERSKAEKDLLESLEFEIELANITTPDDIPRDILNYTEFTTVCKLQKEIPDLDWMKVFTSFIGQYVDINCNDPVEISDPEYIGKFVSLIKNKPKRVIANYAMGQVVFNSRQWLTQRISDISQNIEKVKKGTLVQSREFFCRNTLKYTSDTTIAPIAASAYVQKYFGPDKREKARALISPIRNKVLEVISEADWMDPITRAEALKKISKTLVIVGYPDEILDNTFLENYYNKLSMDKSDFYTNMLNIHKFERYISTSRLHTTVNKQSWDLQHLETIIDPNAYSKLQTNTLDIFSGILSGFMFDAERPLFLNLASIGKTVGHEFTHQVDNKGAQFDVDNNLRNWWQNETLVQFKKKVQDVIDVYSTYVVKEINRTVNGAKDIGEIIADQAGFKITYKALEQLLADLPEDPKLVGFENFSAKQMFWLVAAVSRCSKTRPEQLRDRIDSDVHPPHEFRVKGSYKNSYTFPIDWNCPVDSEMNPKNKFNVW